MDIKLWFVNLILARYAKSNQSEWLTFASISHYFLYVIRRLLLRILITLWSTLWLFEHCFLQELSNLVLFADCSKELNYLFELRFVPKMQHKYFNLYEVHSINRAQKAADLIASEKSRWKSRWKNNKIELEIVGNRPSKSTTNSLFFVKYKCSNSYRVFEWAEFLLETQLVEINAYPRISTTIFYLIWILKFFEVLQNDQICEQLGKIKTTTLFSF